MEPSVTVVRAKGAELYTIVHPHPHPGSDTVILLHGGPCVPDGLGPVASWLAEHFQVIQFHQRGTSRSPCLDNLFRIESYLSDLDSVAKHFHLSTFHLFGHSWGGCYAQIFASRYPKVRSLFLCCSAAGTGRHWAHTMMDVAAFLHRKCSSNEWIRLNAGALCGLLGSTRGFQDQFKVMGINFNKGFPNEGAVPFLVDLVRHRPIIPTVLNILKYPILPEQPAPSFKVSIMYGADDAITSSQKYVRERFPTGKVVTVPSSGHFPWLHNPEFFYRFMTEHYFS